jgi:hypothetical protein
VSRIIWACDYPLICRCVAAKCGCVFALHPFHHNFWGKTFLRLPFLWHTPLSPLSLYAPFPCSLLVTIPLIFASVHRMGPIFTVTPPCASNQSRSRSIGLGSTFAFIRCTGILISVSTSFYCSWWYFRKQFRVEL